MENLIKEYISNKHNLYINIHRDKIFRDTEKSFCVKLENDKCVFIPKTCFLEKEKFFNYVRVFIDTNHKYCITTYEFSDVRESCSGEEIFIRLMKDNKEWNEFSKVYIELKEIDSKVFD